MKNKTVTVIAPVLFPKILQADKIRPHLSYNHHFILYYAMFEKEDATVE
jgi:hypothetical protein